ncbi:hypothetical protein Tcan_01159, partial [Toxocara canis]
MPIEWMSAKSPLVHVRNLPLTVSQFHPIHPSISHLPGVLNDMPLKPQKYLFGCRLLIPSKNQSERQNEKTCYGQQYRNKNSNHKVLKGTNAQQLDKSTSLQYQEAKLNLALFWNFVRRFSLLYLSQHHDPEGVAVWNEATILFAWFWDANCRYNQITKSVRFPTEIERPVVQSGN